MEHLLKVCLRVWLDTFISPKKTRGLGHQFERVNLHCPCMNFSFPSRTEVNYFLEAWTSLSPGRETSRFGTLVAPAYLCPGAAEAKPCPGWMYMSAHLRSSQSKCECLFFVFKFSVCSALKCFTSFTKMRLHSLLFFLVMQWRKSQFWLELWWFLISQMNIYISVIYLDFDSLDF